ncbi:hypothetical protein V1514DRAFT_330030 [Lipomyces japonicus]|uniref:uncharacterized protein n=1 Tax=Lipomyces japonicus TaxID=56871 RepID=UPI0034CE29C8
MTAVVSQQQFNPKFLPSSSISSGLSQDASTSEQAAPIQQPQPQPPLQHQKKQISFKERVLKRQIDSDVKFAFEPFLRKEYQFGIDPSRPICKKFNQGICPLGNECPDRHVRLSAPNRVVCKHWLRGLCKKGDACEFLHEYNLRKMPECTFFARNGFCTQSPDCLYLHIDPQARLPLCPHYEKGFCRLGPSCTKRHVRRVPCELYLAGFCPKGPDCDKVHPKWSFAEVLRIRAKGETIKRFEDPYNNKPSTANEDVIKVLR